MSFIFTNASPSITSPICINFKLLTRCGSISMVVTFLGLAVTTSIPLPPVGSNTVVVDLTRANMPARYAIGNGVE